MEKARRRLPARRDLKKRVSLHLKSLERIRASVRANCRLLTELWAPGPSL